MRLFARFLRVGVFAGFAAGLTQQSMSWPWQMVLTGLLSGVLAAIDKWLRIITGSAK